MIIKQIKIAFSMLLFFTLLTGLIYPGVVTGLAQLLFPWQANGSFIQQDGKAIGSQLIGQSFTDAKYFWGRPSATTPMPYNVANSSGSNTGRSNSDFLKTVSERVTHLQQADLQNHDLVPVDLVTASASGLDPEISPEAAFYQVPRISKIRHVPEQKIEALIHSFIKQPLWGVLGEPRVNVLLLNLALGHLSLLEILDLDKAQRVQEVQFIGHK